MTSDAALSRAGAAAIRLALALASAITAGSLSPSHRSTRAICVSTSSEIENILSKLSLSS